MRGAIEQHSNVITDTHRQGTFATNQFRKHTGNKPILRNGEFKTQTIATVAIFTQHTGRGNDQQGLERNYYTKTSQMRAPILSM